MTCFPTVGPEACGSGSICVSVVLEQGVVNLRRINQVAPHCLTVVVHNGSTLRAWGVSDYDMPGAVTGWLCGIKLGTDSAVYNCFVTIYGRPM